MKYTKNYAIYKILTFFFVFVFFAFEGAGQAVINPTDTPTGFASLGKYKINEQKAVTVNNKKDLEAAAFKGGLIYVDGMIDLSQGLFPKTLDYNSLDAFVSKETAGAYKTYKDFMVAYTKCCKTSTDDGSKNSSTKSPMYETLWQLNHSYGDKIRLSVASGTVLIGINGGGVYGGSISIKGVQNVIIRNLVIQDAYDPFPHHEKDDGYNAQHDAISVQDSSNVWIDHCTIEDTLPIDYQMTEGSTKEKWQTYDGLCDITKQSKNITVSFCKFQNHDKTMLIGSSDSEKMQLTRTITLHHNYFFNCGQRLPMARLSCIHAYNNLYDIDANARYTSQYAIGVRYDCKIIAQNCYFGSVAYSVSGSDTKQGAIFLEGCIDKSKNGKKTGQFKIEKKPLFDIPYNYSLDSAGDLPVTLLENAGAGVLQVQK